MFFITERLKCSPAIPKALHFGKDDIYDYYIEGCATPLIKLDYYNSNKTDLWDSYSQKYSVYDFIKQFKAISKRENFQLLSKVF